jgi:hypothetical protein
VVRRAGLEERAAPASPGSPTEDDPKPRERASVPKRVVRSSPPMSEAMEQAAVRKRSEQIFKKGLGWFI